MTPKTRTALIWIVRVAVAIALVEIGMRVFGFPYLPPSEVRRQSISYVPSHFGGNAIEAKARKVTFSPVVQYKFGNPAYPINSRGFRGPEVDFKKKPGTTRILFVGASSTFDLGASDGEDWPSLAGNELRANGFPNVEVLNFGTPGSISYEATARIATELFLYEPDVIVFSNIWSEVKYFHIQNPLYRIPRNASINLFSNPDNAIDEFFAEHSYVYGSIRSVYLRDYYGKRLLGTPTLEDGSDAGKLDGPSVLGASQYRQNMKTLIAAIRAAGAVPVIMSEHTLATPAASDADWDKKISRELSKHFNHKAIVNCIAFANETLAKTARDEKIDFLDFNREISGRTEFFFDHVHLTAEGGRALSHLVAEALKPILSRRTSSEKR